jgi:hypothetical protein
MQGEKDDLAAQPTEAGDSPVNEGSGPRDEVLSEAKAEQAGESGGGAYPNPHTGKDGSKRARNSLFGHGGQTEQAYHGSGQLGDQKIGEQPNAGSRDD